MDVCKEYKYIYNGKIKRVRRNYNLSGTLRGRPQEHFDDEIREKVLQLLEEGKTLQYISYSTKLSLYHIRKIRDDN